MWDNKSIDVIGVKHMGNNLEKEGVNFLEKLLLSTEMIDPHIPVKDKYPIWDGEIILYKNKNLKNDNILRRIPVQVKTRSYSKIKSSFLIKEVELSNFFKEGGALYFLIQKVGEQFFPYFCELTKFDCNKYLKQCVNKKVKINLEPFPIEKDDILICIERFANEMNKQLMIDENITSIDIGLKKYGNRSIKFELKVPHNRSDMQILEQFYVQKPYIYCNNDQGISIPIGRINDNFKMSIFEKINTEVRLNGEVLYKSVFNEKTVDGQIIFHFGKYITLNITKNSFTYSYNLNKELSERIRDLKFIDAVWNNLPMTIGNNEHGIYLNKENQDEEIKRIKANLEFCIKLKELQKFFHIEKEIDFSLLNDDNVIKTLHLYDFVINKKKVNLGYENDSFIIYTIFNWNILVFAERIGEKPNEFLIKNLFDSKTKKLFTINDVHKSNYYLLLNEYPVNKHIFDADNINVNDAYSIVFEDIEDVNCYSLCNDFSLFFIDLYDENNNKKSLDYAHLIYLKLYERYEEVNFYINMCQVLYRKNMLTENEKNKLVDILNTSESIFTKIACYILLDDKYNANYLLKKLKEEEKTNFLLYPIVKLLKIF